MADPVCPPSPRPPHTVTASQPLSFLSQRGDSLRLITQGNNIHDTLARANTELSAYKIRSALSIYTEILNKLSPGHPCAFLNRSLCYLTLDYPNLAAIDAYRAILAAQWATSEVRTAQSKQILTFARFTVNARTNLDYDWLVYPGCYVGCALFDWLQNDLSSIVVEGRVKQKPADPDGENSIANAFATSTRNVAEDVVLKGYYRLALSLWKCGGGAMKSALDVLCDAQAFSYCGPDDTEQYRKLENAILSEIAEVLDEEEKIKICKIRYDGLKTDAESLERNIQLGFQGLAKTRYTKIKRELYPWDKHSLSVKNQEAIEAIDDMVRQRFGEEIRAGTVSEEGNDRAPKALLYAQDNLSGSRLIFEEFSSFHATGHGWSSFGLPCDSCASFLGISGELALQANARASELREAQSAQGFGRSRSDGSAAPSEGSQRTRSFDITASHPGVKKESSSGSTVRGADVDPSILDSLNRDGTAGTIPPDDAPGYPDGFQVCPGCRLVALCSSKCCELATSIYHTNCCQTGLEQYIRSRVLPYTWPGVPTPEQQVLLSVLFLRILAHTMSLKAHPLAEPWMVGLDGGCDVARDLGEDWKPNEDNELKESWDEHQKVDLTKVYPQGDSWEKFLRDGDNTPKPYRNNEIPKPDRNLIPWSFDNNVRVPLHCLFTMGGAELALDTERFDGWMLETMRAKIAANMRVTRYPRFDKIFDDSGNVKEECVVKQVPVSHEYSDDSGDGIYTHHDNHKEEVGWVASLHPIASLVRVASDNETPNVQLFERNGKITCRTIDNRTAVSLKRQKDKGKERVDSKTVEDSPSDRLSDSMMDMGFESPPPPAVKAGEPLRRVAEIKHLVMEHDSEISGSEWQLHRNSKQEETPMSSSMGTQTESTAFFGAGDTMLDADKTEWSADIEMEDEDDIDTENEDEDSDLYSDEDEEMDDVPDRLEDDDEDRDEEWRTYVTSTMGAGTN